jgi:hypothetical protein
MPRPPAFSPEMALEIKAQMFNGVGLKELATNYNTSYQTMVNIKSGMQYRDIPWPDGTLGGMPMMQVNKLRDQRKFQTKVNNNAAHGGGAPQSEDNFGLSASAAREIDEAFNALARSKGYANYNDYEWSRRRARYERDHAESERKHTEYMNQHRGEFEARVKRHEKNPPKLDPRPELEMVNPEIQNKYTWEYILEMGGKIPVVQVAESDKDIAMRLAIQIYFYLQPQKNWSENWMLPQVARVKSQILKFWETFPEKAPKEIEDVE